MIALKNPVFSFDFLKISKATFWQLLGKAVSTLSGIIILSVVARSFGEEGTGLYTLALTYLAFFYLAADLGLNAYILPKIALDETETNRIFSLRITWSIALIFLAITLSFLLPVHNSSFNLMVAIGSLTILSSAILSSTNIIFQRFLRFDFAITGSSLGAAFSLIIVLFLVFIKAPVVFLPLGILSGSLLNMLAALVLSQKFYKFSFVVPKKEYVLGIVKDAWPISLTLVLNTVYFRADSFILSSFYPISTVGAYNLAYQIFQTILVIPTFIMNSYYPLMLEKTRINFLQALSSIKGVGLALLLLSFLAIGLTWVFAPLAVFILTGSNFSGSDVALRILSLGLPAFFLTSLLMLVMIALGKYKQLAIIYFLGLLANVVLNILWIPSLSFYAASWVTVVSEYVILVLQIIILAPLFFKDQLENQNNQ